MKTCFVFFIVLFTLGIPVLSQESKRDSQVDDFYVSFLSGFDLTKNGSFGGNIDAKLHFTSGWGLGARFNHNGFIARNLPEDYDTGILCFDPFRGCYPVDVIQHTGPYVTRAIPAFSDHRKKMCAYLGGAWVRYRESEFQLRDGLFGETYDEIRNTQNATGIFGGIMFKLPVTNRVGWEFGLEYFHNEFVNSFTVQFGLIVGKMSRPEYNIPSAKERRQAYRAKRKQETSR